MARREATSLGSSPPVYARRPLLRTGATITSDARARDLPQQPSLSRLHHHPYLPRVHGALSQDRSARLRHDPRHLRPRRALRRAQEPQALFVRLPGPRDLLRARRQRDPRRPGPGREAAAHDRRGRVPRARRHLLGGAGDARGSGPRAPAQALKALTFLARRFVAGEAIEDAVAVGLRLHARGIRATFDLLGEDVRDRDAAYRCAEANKALIRAI